MYDDLKRKAVDSAKKRAVSQQVDYDTFKNMVLVAHLQPIQASSNSKKDTDVPTWQFNADGSVARPQSSASASVLPVAEPTAAPSSSGEFQREWKRNCPSLHAKLRYLQLCTPSNLPLIFKVEISSQLLGEILSALQAGSLAAAEDSTTSSAGAAVAGVTGEWVVDVLTALTGCGRFKLHARLLSRGIKQGLGQLFDKLQQAIASTSSLARDIDNTAETLHPDITTLRALYGM